MHTRFPSSETGFKRKAEVLAGRRQARQTLPVKIFPETVPFTGQPQRFPRPAHQMQRSHDTDGILIPQPRVLQRFYNVRRATGGKPFRQALPQHVHGQGLRGSDRVRITRFDSGWIAPSIPRGL